MGLVHRCRDRSPQSLSRVGPTQAAAPWALCTGCPCSAALPSGSVPRRVSPHSCPSQSSRRSCGLWPQRLSVSAGAAGLWGVLFNLVGGVLVFPTVPPAAVPEQVAALQPACTWACEPLSHSSHTGVGSVSRTLLPSSQAPRPTCFGMSLVYILVILCGGGPVVSWSTYVLCLQAC